MPGVTQALPLQARGAFPLLSASFPLVAGSYHLLRLLGPTPLTQHSARRRLRTHHPHPYIVSSLSSSSSFHRLTSISCPLKHTFEMRNGVFFVYDHSKGTLFPSPPTKHQVFSQKWVLRVHAALTEGAPERIACNLPDVRTFFTDINYLMRVATHGPAKTISYHRQAVDDKPQNYILSLLTFLPHFFYPFSGAGLNCSKRASTFTPFLMKPKK